MVDEENTVGAAGNRSRHIAKRLLLVAHMYHHQDYEGAFGSMNARKLKGAGKAIDRPG